MQHWRGQKEGVKEDKIRWTDSITDTVGAFLADLKGQVGDRTSWKRFVYMIAKH